LDMAFFRVSMVPLFARSASASVTQVTQAAWKMKVGPYGTITSL
jgi:hypothetical protein